MQSLPHRLSQHHRVCHIGSFLRASEHAVPELSFVLRRSHSTETKKDPVKTGTSQSSLKALFSKAPSKKAVEKKPPMEKKPPVKTVIPQVKDDTDLFDEEEEEDVIAVTKTAKNER